MTHSYGVETGSRPDGLELVEVKRVGSDTWRRYFLSALGNPLARLFDTDQRESARGVGRVLLFLSALALGFMYWRRRDRDCWSCLLPWAAAGAFAVGVACLLAFGRSDAPGRAVMPRYIPMTLFLVIALVAIAAYVFTWWVSRAGDDVRAARRRGAYGWGAAAALVVLLLNLWVYGFHKMGAWKGARLQARAALIYINHFEPVKIGRLDSSLKFVREQANTLNTYGLLDPPLAGCWGFACFSQGREVLGEKRAKLGSHNLQKESLDVSGYALLPSGRIADGVLISIRGSEGDDWQVVGFAEMRSSHTINNIFLDTHFGQGPNLVYIDQYAGFRGRAVNDGSFAAAGELLCWAIDAEKRVAYPIGEALPLGGVDSP